MPLRTKKTSIGQSPHSRPKNKNQRHHWKRSRGQGHKGH